MPASKAAAGAAGDEPPLEKITGERHKQETPLQPPSDKYGLRRPGQQIIRETPANWQTALDEVVCAAEEKAPASPPAAPLLEQRLAQEQEQVAAVAEARAQARAEALAEAAQAAAEAHDQAQAEKRAAVAAAQAQKDAEKNAAVAAAQAEKDVAAAQAQAQVSDVILNIESRKTGI